MKFYLLIIVLGLLSISGCNFSLSRDVTPPPDYTAPAPPADIGTLYPEKPPNPYKGELLFLENCTPCHGESGLGNGVLSPRMPVAVPAIGLSDISRNASPAEWYQIITLGNMERGMPPFYDYPVKERWDILAYVYQLSSTPDELQLGEEIYKSNCSDCHGVSGKGNSMVDFTDQEYMSQVTNLYLYRSIAEGKEAMRPFLGELKEDDIWSVTAYLRSLSYDMFAPDPTPTISPESSPTITPIPSLTGESTQSETPESATTEVSQLTEQPILEIFTITGQVTNMTGTDLEEDLIATLVFYNTIEKKVFDSQSTLINPGGTFSFTDLTANSNTAIWVTVDYQGVTYYSELYSLEDEPDSLTVPVQVYDATTEWLKLRFDIVHITLEISDNLMTVNEIFILSNPGMSTITIETDGTSLPFINLPEGVTEFTSLSPDSRGESFLPFSGGIAIPPNIDNQYGVVASFSIPYNRRLDFRQEFPMVIDTISLFAPETTKMKSEQLLNLGEEEYNGTLFQKWEISNFPSGLLSITISGSSGESNLGIIDNQSWFTFTLGALGVLIIGLGIYLYFRNRQMEKKEETDEEIHPIDEAIPSKSMEKILDAIIALDADLENGKISKEIHQEQREKLISKLKSND